MTYALRYMPDSPPPDDLAERNRRSRLRWEAAKKEYLAGETARVVCARHDMPLSTFRHRASVEGWRRRDADDLLSSPRVRGETNPSGPKGQRSMRGPTDRAPITDIPPSSPVAEAPGDTSPHTVGGRQDDDPTYARLAADARRHMVRAVRAGRPLDAQRWLKLTRQFTDLADQETKAAEQQAIASAEAADTAARDAGVLIDLAGPLPFGKLSEDQLIYAANALRRAIDSCAARKQAAERARQSAEILDSQPEKRLDSPLSSPACGGGGPPPGPSEARPEDRLHGGGGEPRTPAPAAQPPSPSGSTRGPEKSPARPQPPERRPLPGDAEAPHTPAPAPSPAVTADRLPPPLNRGVGAFRRSVPRPPPLG
ncbi:hypothetical protein [Brevundimonas lutea]|uniref:hypothetical protein n=1 Tax=Brevundimonas lutea TaxID=2293980 RepID=UPI000F03761B|nr:hypothetical protein [Brevundimonas lutea]